jgi:LPXTG-motif cell wall-anchored protein
MNTQDRIMHRVTGFLLYALAATAFAAGAFSQDMTTQQVEHGDASHEIEVRNAKVVYVEGRDLVLKHEDGRVEHMIVPETDEFMVGGKKLNVHQLQPGTSLTQVITTTTTPRQVKTVRTLKGKVWHVNAPRSVIVSLPDGTNHRYEVPSHAKFTVNGQPKTVFDLRKGMMFEATIITDEPQRRITRQQTTFGQAPRPVMPPIHGVLLIQPSQPEVTPAPEATVAPVETASVELPVVLPKTGSELPWLVVMGALSVTLGMALGTLRRKLVA